MTYDKLSFLSGMAVGRQMKGWSLGGYERSGKAWIQPSAALVANRVIPVGAAVPAESGGTLSSLAVLTYGAARSAAAAVPGGLGGNLSALASTGTDETRALAAAVPGGTGGGLTALSFPGYGDVIEAAAAVPAACGGTLSAISGGRGDRTKGLSAGLEGQNMKRPPAVWARFTPAETE